MSYYRDLRNGKKFYVQYQQFKQTHKLIKHKKGTLSSSEKSLALKIWNN